MYAAPDVMGPLASAIFVEGMGLALPLAAALVFAVLALRARAERLRIAGELTRPGRGGAVVVAGIAEHDPQSAGEAGPLVELDLHQHGTEARGKNRWFVTWREVSRRVSARPFYLRRDGGALLRVEPGEQVELDDLLGPPEPGPSFDARRRRAVLSPGERVYVEGRLERGIDPRAPSPDDPYRGGGGEAPILRPLDGRLLISSEPIDDRFRRRARRWARFAIYLAAMAALVQLLAGHWHALKLRGEVVDARVAQTRTWTTRVKNGTRRHCSVTADLPDGRQLTAECALFLCGPNPPLIVPWIALPNDPGQIGREAGVNAMAAPGLILLVFFSFVALAAIEQKGRRWFERARVVDVTPGRLPPN